MPICILYPLRAAMVGGRARAVKRRRTTIAISAEPCTNPVAMGVQALRLSETVHYLETEGLDALVAVNYGHNSFLESHAVFVLSGVRPIGESAVVVDRSGASTLIVTPAWDAERAAKLSQTGKTVATDDLAATLAAVLAEHRLEGRAIVSVGLSTLAHGLAERIEAALGNSRANELFIRQLAR